MNNRGNKWSKREIQKTKSLYQKGISIKTISLLTKRTPSAIQKKAKEFNLTNRRKLWTLAENSKLLKHFNEGLSNFEISEMMNRSVRSIQSHLLKLGQKRKDVNAWKFKQRDDFWTKSEIGNLKSYVKQGLSCTEISIKIGRSKGTIFNKMATMSLKIKPKSAEEECKYRRAFDLDDNYFENINTQKKAYFLGWILTDGWIDNVIKSKRGCFKSNKIGLKISIKDIEVLEEFKNELKSINPLKFHKKKLIRYKNKITGKESNIKSGKQVSLEFSSYKMQKDLSKYGVTNQKTYIVGFPYELKREYYPGFIAGVISGDGSVDIKKNRNRMLLRITIAGNFNLLSPIKEILIEKINFNQNKKIYKVKNSLNLHILELSQSESLNLYHWLSQNGISLMKRKNNRIEEFMKFQNIKL